MRALISLSAVAAVLQTAPVSPDLQTILSPIERLTLVAALVAAVKVLWSANSTKDTRLLDMSGKVTETMVSVMDAVRELRKSTEELGDAIDQLTANVAALESQRGNGLPKGRD